MKIAFPLLNEKELAEDFVHSTYIGVYDDVKNTTELIVMTGYEKGVSSSLFFSALIDRGLKAVVCPFYSYMSLRVFKENNIETLKAISTDFEENVKELKDHMLMPYDVYEALLTGPCARDCTSCGTTCES